MPTETFPQDAATVNEQSGVEQMRGSVRFPLRLPVRLKTGSGTVDTITEDISSTGVQFSGNKSVPVGTVLHWDICLPAAIMGSPGDVKVSCTGRVMWVRQADLEHRFGVVIDSYVLRGNQE